MQARAVAVKVLCEVLNGASLSRALPRWQAKVDPNQQPLLQELCYGTLRWQPRLQSCVEQLIQKPLKNKDRDLQCLLWMGLYQLQYMRLPDHAVVDETVKTAPLMGKKWARSLVNGVLRSFIRDSEAIVAKVDQSEPGRYSHPQWLIDLSRKAWPQDWETLLQANNDRPPMTLRVNEKQLSSSQYLELLQQKGMSAELCSYSSSGITLETPVNVDSLPLFDQGGVSVQDQAAQLAAYCLDVQTGQRVLDVCAAPGGKAAHILERQPDCQLYALDQDPLRIERVHETLGRLGLNAKTLVADARQTQQWWDGDLFDRILLDAPCTASGVLRRHPDAKVLKKQSDVASIVLLQGQILDAVWPLLRPGGMLLYATCSIWPEENVLQIQSFLDRTEDAKHQVIQGDWGRSEVYGRQILPGEDQMDGFYYAALVKR